MGNGERGRREEQMALEQEIAQQERVMKIGTNPRLADGPSTEWLARHFPPYRHSEGIGQQLGRFCVTHTSPPGLKSPALARSVRRLGQGHAITFGCALFVALRWFTLMTTTLTLIHQWSALLGTNISGPDTTLNLTSNRQHLRLGRRGANSSSANASYTTRSATRLPRHRIN
jgi:hypothetical protein